MSCLPRKRVGRIVLRLEPTCKEIETKKTPACLSEPPSPSSKIPQNPTAKFSTAYVEIQRDPKHYENLKLAAETGRGVPAAGGSHLEALRAERRTAMDGCSVK